MVATGEQSDTGHLNLFFLFIYFISRRNLSTEIPASLTCTNFAYKLRQKRAGWRRCNHRRKIPLLCISKQQMLYFCFFSFLSFARSIHLINAQNGRHDCLLNWSQRCSVGLRNQVNRWRAQAAASTALVLLLDGKKFIRYALYIHAVVNGTGQETEACYECYLFLQLDSSTNY